MIQLCPGDWVNQMSKMNEAVIMKNRVTVGGGGKRIVCTFRRQEFWKCIGFFNRKLHMERKDTRFGVNNQNIMLIWHLLNHKEIFVGTPIYIGYVVISIILFTSMLAIELFILHNFVHLLNFYLITYLYLSLIGLRHILDKV